ncbi:hypothetical protein FOCG_14498 [Fusarium oxysporum f. sp. radicis-lycopersici 26381]|nr:uncharacterized protein FOBCDRAFT_50470 [Fusarium oxysporum Fo47]EWZ31661.1 hypothetical protein FOZG_14780 [Fusarium oxysporum Fo47]EWZ94246.1 hypothetical protein FOWG_04604 [Fusarium oxysporum f. sp. lycopersici MN25]EXL42938.1 hypothetical protein FOCG_14498 [Fusarium oxysporum f. sp. radicis-lycopersici 26381]QKD58887.1 hypothetical protein FOBCDRAFT_50470 [Fusarium oxysporum Fo47]
MPKMLAPGFRTRRSSSFIRFGALAALVLFAFWSFSNRSPAPSLLPIQKSQPAAADGAGSFPAKAAEQPFSNKPVQGAHPIDKLINDGGKRYKDILSRESHTLEEAAQAYRKRRGRHPPPGFDKWWDFAKQNNAIVVEEFWDQVYHDIDPFWGVPQPIIRKEAYSFEMSIHIRNGKANSTSDWFWTLIWLDMIRSIEHMVPDLDMPLNAMDEPRLVVPWEDIDGYMTKGAASRSLWPAKEVVSEFQKLPTAGRHDRDVRIPFKRWEKTSPYWPIARRGCPPDSPARQAPLKESFNHPPEIDISNAEKHSFAGYVSNFTLSSEICHQPDLQGLNGLLINPISVSSTKVLFPMFGGSKLAINNEILLPPPIYWKGEDRFTGGEDDVEWQNKGNTVVWRGVATGGKNKPENWRGFHRHRFVSMLNQTKVSAVEHGKEKPENFVLPSEQYNLHAQADGRLGEWVGEWSEVGFVDLMCSPSEEDGRCWYTDHYFAKVDGMDMHEQFDYKYVPDIDGNSFSGRYLGFLNSTSLPIKATLFREWHDSRLVPWVHFVPMDNRFQDFYGIMEYFRGYGETSGHDKAAQRIALEGKEWANKVLRKEDMQIYVLRLLLEYGRVIADDRDKMGWVDDALKDPSIEKTWSKLKI